MNEKDARKKELEQELQWVQYRQRMLYIIDLKLIQMKQLAEVARQGNLDFDELQLVNYRIKNLATQVNALDEESKK